MAFFTRLASTEPVTLSGVVTHVRNVSDTSGRDRGSVSTTHETWFRVDGHPAIFGGVSSIAEGDSVTVAGRDRGDAVMVVALRNDDTGIQTAPIIRTWPMYALIVMGVPLIPFLGLGVLLILMGLAGFKGNSQNKEMIALLERTPSKPKRT